MFLSESLPIINTRSCSNSLQLYTFYVKKLVLVKKLLRFMHPRAIQGSSADVSIINVKDSSKHKQLSGFLAKAYVDDCDDLSTNDVKQFWENCKMFWIAGAEYAIKQLPFNNKLLASVSWMLPLKQDLELENQVLGVATELPQVITLEQKSALREEFMDYCTYQLPSPITSITDIAAYWYQIGKLTDVSGDIRSPLLCKLAKAILVLVIPHSNADVERMFSQTGLNKTKLRNSLGTKTLTALLRLQMNAQEPCNGNCKKTHNLCAL